jgi:hypothetical protein
MTKHFTRPQHAPRPTKGTLVAAAKKQVAADEAKAEAEARDKTAALVSPEEMAKVDEQLGAPTAEPERVGELSGPVLALVRNMANDAAADSATKPATTPPAETAPAAASPIENVVMAQMGLDPQPAVRPPKGTNPTGLYTFGKRYSPKTDRNMATWNALVKALTEGPKTMQQLTEVVKEAKHGDFLGYMTRGGHIVPAQVSG